MKIYLDSMGGDHAPAATVEGAREALGLFPELTVELGGPLETVTAEVERAFADAPALRERLVLTDCPEVITNDESPVMAVRKKKTSAIVDGMLKLREGTVDAFVSAGSTGAVLAGGMFRLGRIKGIDRPALAPLLPNGKDYFLLIDCGANVDCRPEYLAQFALMGNAYMQGMRGIQSPRIGLVNNGAESEKGCALTKAAYELLEHSNLRFVGNVEARDITADVADVIVCDGFVGNVALKLSEGLAASLSRILKRELLGSSLAAKLGTLLAKGAFKRVARFVDYAEYGGAPLLGLQGIVIVCHGKSNIKAITSATTMAALFVEKRTNERLVANILANEELARFGKATK